MQALAYSRQHRERFLNELIAFLRIPSVSTQPEHKEDILKAATWLADQMRKVGFPRVEVMPTAGHPIVYAEWLAAGPQAPTVLIYGHYDVQPPDPLELWDTPPFEPALRGNSLFARGASDDKGQTYIHLKAIESIVAASGIPPVNVKCVIEGEEESGSVHFEAFIRDHKEMLTADVAVISDTHILGEDLPCIVYALRGLAYVEVKVTGPDHDLHSGVYGGAVNNPINALAHMLSKLQDEDGQILIPGFYDDVRVLADEERQELARVPFHYEKWLEEAGVKMDWGVKDYTIIERTGAQPTLDVNGIWGGYIEKGAKTVLPSHASAKISMRLVADQTPAKITKLIRDYLLEIAPPSVTVEVSDLHGGAGAIVPRDHPAVQAAYRAYQEVFDVEPVFIREGGSIPVVANFQDVLGIETVLMGFGLPDDRLHSPNEKLSVTMFYKGIETVIRFLMTLPEMMSIPE